LLNEEKPTAPAQEGEKLSRPNLENTENKIEQESESDNDKEKESDNSSERVTPAVDNSKDFLPRKKDEFSLFKEKESARQKIEQLLKKHSLETKDLPEEHQN
jgi:hypothetical protein